MPKITTMDVVDGVNKILAAKDVVIKGGKSTIHTIVNEAIGFIATGLEQEGSTVVLRGFGTFKAERKKARIGRNPQTGKEVMVPEKIRVSFKPSKNK